MTRYEELMPELLRPWVSQVPTPESFILLNQLGEISRRVTAAYGQFLRPHGIDFSEYVLLWALRLHHPQSPAMSELRRRVVMSSGGIALAANRLERKGLARRRASERDRRTVLLALTAEGRRLIDALMAEDLERHQRLLAPLTPDRRIEVLDGLAEILDRLIDARDDRRDTFT
jgi:DNA-binding MarR family transcriptional regulator